MADKPAPPKVPPRNDFTSDTLYRNSRATELQGRDQDFVYESFSTDPASPAYIGNRLTQHERGNAATGYVMVGAWEVVHSQTDKNVRALDPRTDQGAAVDTVARYGRQITCRIPRREYAKYQLAEAAYQEMIEKQIYEPDRIRGGQTSLTTVVSKDENADHIDLLRRGGHPMPGG
jgi:hypothetical protein